MVFASYDSKTRASDWSISDLCGRCSQAGFVSNDWSEGSLRIFGRACPLKGHSVATDDSLRGVIPDPA